VRLEEQDQCALCGILLPRSGQPTVVTVGRDEKVYVCTDASGCRRRAIELLRAYEQMKEKL
jgi:alpha-D-ribose 1-methylphosphonate 5-phosphate C-P lyase